VYHINKIKGKMLIMPVVQKYLNKCSTVLMIKSFRKLGTARNDKEHLKNT
jgi:hypothetical protein